MTRLIQTEADLAEGADWLAKAEPRFAPILAQTGPLPLRLKPQGFEGLLDIIIGQQVSTASAKAIRARMESAGFFDIQAVRSTDEEDLRNAGLSRPKARYARILAQEDLDYIELAQDTDAAVFERLTRIKGIGPWTAQIYIMFCLGRADGFAPGDLALQVAAQSVFALEERPSSTELEDLSKSWSPWRSVAARALFAYYRILKNREGLA